ncbi:hypothetical protein K432DRAFT_311667 [Lepidopterella palustris CBS 459.81]|uniref:Uncharacterized protein n=1 Tax=Lepidopterella palustris CBS 459.81 TaxID=1314670 RepID=A0A8E2J964_9PEZI|nr:hypothetical protein K432DRAFT_311667 [Lepidopterella palustris CBS 459.81]
MIFNHGRGRTRSRSTSVESFRSFNDSPTRKHVAERISSHTDLIPLRYSGETDVEMDRILRIMPFKRNVYVVSHGACPSDFAQYSWILNHGVTERWYEQPSPELQHRMAVMEAADCLPESFLVGLEHPNPLTVPVPRVWASAALTTPTDDDIYDCLAGHSVDEDFAGACHQCTDEKSEALDRSSLVYYLVLSTFQGSVLNTAGSGKAIYRIVKCGRREAAAAEAFYAAGVNGWNVVFSCVTKDGEGFAECRGKEVDRLENLWRFVDNVEDGGKMRVFY